MMFSKFAYGMLAMTMANSAFACDTIADVACGLDDFSTLCTAVKAAGLVDALSGDAELTVFAPTNEAFANLGSTLDDVLADTTLLTDILLFHVVAGKIAFDDLEPSETVEMLNGQDSRTIQTHPGPTTFQKGGSNSRNNAPEIIATDIPTCQGFIHVVDEVLLPGTLVTSDSKPDKKPDMPPPKDDCSTIAEIACSLDDFSTLCTAVKAAGLAGVLSGDDKFTVFAPTNSAFAELGDALDDIVADVPVLTDILLFHVVAGKVMASDLHCAGTIEMVSGDKTRTICTSKGIFQKGAGNPRSNKPEIVATDIGACNGIIHVVDAVLLPHEF